MGRVIAAFSQFLTGDAEPLARGWLRFLESGTNNTDKNTYSDPTYQIPNANPLQLDAEGRCPDVFGTGDYRVVSFENDPEDEDSPGTQIQSFDPVTAEAGPDTGGGAGSFQDWDILETYALGDIVTYNTEYYRSLVAGNLGNNPSVEEGAWEKVDFVRYWNSTITYSQGDLVYYNYNLYLGKQNINLSNDPETSPAWWRPVATGYHNVYVKTTDYEILPTEYDSVFVLGSAAIADSQFDLPAMDATTDGFKVAIYNESNYALTISALGTSTVWIDSTGDLVLENSAFQEFFYSYDLDTWMPVNNSAQALGGQTLGTATNPIANALITALSVTTATITNLNVTATHVPSDEFIFFGDADETNISYNSTDVQLQLSVPTGTDISFFVNSLEYWTVDSGGALLAGASNPVPNIGSDTNFIGALYAGDIYVPDLGVIYLGPDSNFVMRQNGTDTTLYSYVGRVYFGTTTADGILFLTSGTSAMAIDASGNVTVYGENLIVEGATQAINFGNPSAMDILHDGSNGYWTISTGAMYFQTGAGPSTAMLIDTSGNVSFYNNTSIGTNELHYIGDSNQANIGYTAANGLRIGTATAEDVYLFSNNTNRWRVTSAGHFYPAANQAYSIGAASTRVNYTYSRYFYGDQLTAPGDLNIWCQNGTYSTSSGTIPPGYAYTDYHWNKMVITRITRRIVPAASGDILYLEVTVGGANWVFIGEASPL